MLLRCPKCKSEFVQFLREPQTTNECRKCGAKIPMDALARFEFTCPACKKESYGRTNVEDAEECKGIKSATAYKIAEFAREQGYLE